MSREQPATVSRRVHDVLRQRILAGELEPGGRIPSERLLAEEFQVNRHAVREALKRLEQAGLIRITHGGATRVLDWRDSGGLEILLDLGGNDLDPPAELVRSILEMRASVGIDAARLCADRADVEARERVAGLAEQAAGLVDSGDPGQLDRAYAEFWSAIVAGSGNIAYRLSLNSLQEAMVAMTDVAELVRPDAAEAITGLGRSIGAGEPEKAAALAGALLLGDAARAG